MLNKRNNLEPVKIGVFGGSGFYDFLDSPQEIEIETEYGQPSSKIMTGVIAGKRVAFLPRHGVGHIYPPHKVPYKANIAAFKKIGVKQIIAPAACGSLNKEVGRGDFVILDQLVDRTNGRDDTFYHGLPRASVEGADNIGANLFPTDKVVHISTADPYCNSLRAIAIKAGNEMGVKIHEKGTAVVIQGPRFSTKAESKWFQSAGWEVINMTQYPEAVLAREAEMCYCGIALITDYDTGVDTGEESVTLEEVIKVFGENNQKVKKLIFAIIKNMDETAECVCRKALEGAAIN